MSHYQFSWYRLCVFNGCMTGRKSTGTDLTLAADSSCWESQYLLNAFCLVAVKKTHSLHEEQRWQFCNMDTVSARGPWKYFGKSTQMEQGSVRKESTDHKSSHGRRTRLDKNKTLSENLPCSAHKERRNAVSKCSISGISTIAGFSFLHHKTGATEKFLSDGRFFTHVPTQGLWVS